MRTSTAAAGNAVMRSRCPDRFVAEEPAISRGIRRAFPVPDATIDPWRPVNRLGDYVNRRGGRVLARRAVNRCRSTGTHNGTDERQADLWSVTDPPL